MAAIMLGLLGFSIILFIISFFQRDTYKSLKDEFDQFTMQQVQENYLLKKKLKVLEEELLVNDIEAPSVPLRFKEEGSRNQKREIHDIIKNQVLALAQQGKPIEQIAQQSSLSINEVYAILKELSEWGKNNG
ncbi:hypothetical protein [Neobacillus terrae]|uniref:hypothetical protein n=1 Tax=Neobacillus terrae TaxID=3034837 RepID=UPI0014098695|nr:hypothetical protein [Neobacillus terrae]NHM30315.1 hypothetical protein [Neobacillus terrae]